MVCAKALQQSIFFILYMAYISRALPCLPVETEKSVPSSIETMNLWKTKQNILATMVIWLVIPKSQFNSLPKITHIMDRECSMIHDCPNVHGWSVKKDILSVEDFMVPFIHWSWSSSLRCPQGYSVSWNLESFHQAVSRKGLVKFWVPCLLLSGFWRR